MTEKVVEDVEPVVASGDDTEAAPVEDAPAPAVETVETPVVESSEAVPEVTENGNKEAEAVEPVEEAGKLLKRAHDDLISIIRHSSHLNFQKSQ